MSAESAKGAVIPSYAATEPGVAGRANRGTRTTDRTPPHSTEAEAAVLGCCLLSPSEAIPSCVDVFSDDDTWLYDPRHRTLWAVARRVWERGHVDMVTIIDALGADLERAGGYEYILGCSDSVPSAAALPHYLAVVREKWLLRRLIHAGHHLIESAFKCEDLPATLDAAEAEVSAITRGDSGKIHTLTGQSLALAATEYAEQLYNETHPESSTRVLRTGLAGLDRLVKLRPGAVGIIAGRPGTGKTSLACTIACHVCSEGLPVGFLSLEVMGDELAHKLACMVARLSSSDIKHGMAAEDFGRMTEAIECLRSWKLYIEAGSGMSVWTARKRLRGMVQRHGIKLGVIDYLQLLRGEKRERREEEVASVSRGLKALAIELRIPLLVLAQLNREVDKGQAPRRPRESDLRESGSIEADADHIWLLDREHEPQDPDAPRVNCIVAKQRNGPTGDVPLVFRKAITLFEDCFE